MKRHDRVGAEVHFKICKEIGEQLYDEHWNEHISKSVETSHEDKVTILWNQKNKPTEPSVTIK